MQKSLCKVGCSNPPAVKAIFFAITEKLLNFLLAVCLLKSLWSAKNGCCYNNDSAIQFYLMAFEHFFMKLNMYYKKLLLHL